MLNMKTDQGMLYNYMSITNFSELIHIGEWKFSNIYTLNDFRESDAYLRFKDEVDKTLIACFSNSCKVPSMWHNYAMMHTGVCIGIDTEKLQSELTKINGVNFELRQINYMSLSTYNDTEFASRNSFVDYLSIKDNSWSYENECRLFVRIESEEDRNIKYKLCASAIFRSITTIVFGWKCLLDKVFSIKTPYCNSWESQKEFEFPTPIGNIVTLKNR